MDDEKVPSKLEAAIEWLKQDPYLMAVISAMPVAGGSITQVLTGIGQQIVQERNERLFEQVSEHLATIDKEAIRRNYFETPEGFDLLIKALDESRKTRSDEKRDLIARILAGATSTDAGNGGYSPEECLNVVADLTEKELKVARTIYDVQFGQNYRNMDVQDKWKAWEEQRDKITEIYDLDPDDLTLILDRIASTGLVALSYVQFPGSPGQTYWVTSAFDRLMGFLKLRA